MIKINAQFNVSINSQLDWLAVALHDEELQIAFPGAFEENTKKQI